MISELIQTLVESKNEAADDVLLEALSIGSEPEKLVALDALLKRKTVHGLSGVIKAYAGLPRSSQLMVLEQIGVFHAALRECGRGRDPLAAMAAMKLIALGRQGRLTYVLSEGLHHPDEAISRAAVEAMVALARWAATETRRLQRSDSQLQSDGKTREERQSERQSLYRRLMEERPEIEQAVSRAMDVHRGRHTAELVRASLLLADSPLSRTLAILGTAKHGGQTALVRRLGQPPDSEHVEAFLLGASHAGLRTHFGVTFAHINDGPVLDALLRKTHWLKDNQLQLCMHQVSRGVWWGEAELERDLSRRDDEDAARIAEWIAASGVHDVVQDERLEKLRRHLAHHLPGRLRLLRVAMRRPRGASVALLRSLLEDPDERVVRMAAREIVRRRPLDFENMLLQLMTTAPESVRRVIGRAVGQVGFDHFWQRFDRMDKSTRKVAGRAMLKMLPDGLERLERRLRSGPVEQRVKAIQIVQELGVADSMAGVVLRLCEEANPKLRSKAVALLAEVTTLPPEALLERMVNDDDARVRANAIEVVEAQNRLEFVPMLATRARSSHNRERANAIKALHRMKVGTASPALLSMLRDERSEHRISALWALRQIGWWQLVSEVGRLAKDDPNLRVRRYAMGVLKTAAEVVEQYRRRDAG